MLPIFGQTVSMPRQVGRRRGRLSWSVVGGLLDGRKIILTKAKDICCQGVQESGECHRGHLEDGRAGRTKISEAGCTSEIGGGLFRIWYRRIIGGNRSRTGGTGCCLTFTHLLTRTQREKQRCFKSRIRTRLKPRMPACDYPIAGKATGLAQK